MSFSNHLTNSFRLSYLKFLGTKFPDYLAFSQVGYVMYGKFGLKIPHIDNVCTFSSPNEIFIHVANMY